MPEGRASASVSLSLSIEPSPLRAWRGWGFLSCIRSWALLQGFSQATRKLTKNGVCDLPSACLFAPDDSSLTSWCQRSLGRCLHLFKKGKGNIFSFKTFCKVCSRPFLFLVRTSGLSLIWFSSGYCDILDKLLFFFLVPIAKMPNSWRGRMRNLKAAVGRGQCKHYSDIGWENNL